MFISLNFPIADFRGLRADQAGRLTVPAWGKADPRASFARGFGSIHTRSKSGIGYIGENYYADCQNFIRYPNLKFLEPLHKSDRSILMYPIYRRFFFDGDFCGRFELGFRLNYPTIDHINAEAEYRGLRVLYDPVEIAHQVMRTALELHLLDGRVIGTEACKSVELLRDGYLLSSTKTSALHQHNVAEVGSKYVSVGKPFVVIRSNPETPAADVKHRRDVFRKPEIRAFLLSSGIPNQRFDTLFIDSPELWNEETARERLTRIVYTQMRVLLYVYSVYLDRVESGEISGRSLLTKAIAGLVTRIETLLPIPENSEDQLTCELMRELIGKLDINPSALAIEIEKTLQVGWLRRNVGKVFGFVDRKSDVAIEAAASTITETMLRGF